MLISDAQNPGQAPRIGHLATSQIPEAALDVGIRIMLVTADLDVGQGKLHDLQDDGAAVQRLRRQHDTVEGVSLELQFPFEGVARGEQTVETLVSAGERRQRGRSRG